MASVSNSLLSTAIIASYLILRSAEPMLGMKGKAAPLSPPCDPPSGKDDLFC